LSRSEIFEFPNQVIYLHIIGVLTDSDITLKQFAILL